MRITVEISLYPLQEQYLSKIEAFIAELRRAPGLEIVVNQMSTQLRGELGDVMAALEAAIRQSFGDAIPEVLVAKFLNADLPIRETPPV
jgi:uncharacterized protein YqgV (UPF0045/DUF77 family)